jgi:DNA-binding NarL/FixJ family response regulator
VDKPETGAREMTAWLKAHYPSVRVLALSMERTESLIHPLLDCGAMGFLLKTADHSEMNTALRKVLTGGYYFSPPLLRWF